ncbi:MAG: InlB B-repeat-containing protein [Bacilli bacterium]|nr:InlB B-repeat-containing protein [Bacilli bacterium]
MTNNISITASTTEQFKEEYNISFSGTNCTATGAGITSQDIFNITATNTDSLQFTIVPIGGYELTNNINFKINNVTADPSDYSYLPDGSTGNYILKFNPKGETVIGIEAEPKKTKYDITFDSNGGSAVQAISVIEGEITNPPTDPTRSDYAFDGWYYDDDTFEYKFDFATTAIYENVELHAKWVSTDIVLTFDAGAHGLCESNFERKYELGITKGKKWKDIANRIYGGYINNLEFLCWTLDGVNPISDDYVFNESTTLQARYAGVSQEYLTLTPRSNATLTINPPGDGTRTFSYQRTGDTGWTPFTSGTDVDLEYGQQIYIKGSDDEAIGQAMFGSSSYFSVSGLCGSLFQEPTLLPNSAYSNLFQDFNVICAHNLLLPKTTLSIRCYALMFSDTYTITAPKIPATSFQDASCLMTFQGCSNLKLTRHPTTDIESDIYTKFFEVPQHAAVEGCFECMFLGTGGPLEDDTPERGRSYYYYN